MAEIVLGIGTSHSPILCLPPELWETFAHNDRHNRELMFPPDGLARSFDDALPLVPDEIRAKPRDLATFTRQSAACSAALDELAATLQAAAPDVTVIISDDQDEWFFEDNMPSLAVYWGDTVRMIPREGGKGRAPEVVAAIREGYGDEEMDVAVASDLGRHVVTHLADHDFDPAQLTYAPEQRGGRVARRYPTPSGELDHTVTTEPKRQGLPHGFAFVVKRLSDNQPGPILPVFQNTCYPPNHVRPRRAVAVGRALGRAIADWPVDARVAIVASGGLSHFVVDEELDRQLLLALQTHDLDALASLPRHRLYSATSESLNWATLGAALHDTPLTMDLLDYVPVYRTEAGTGGGWSFARWQ